MALMTAVLKWKDTGSLGRTDKGDEETVLPSVSVTIWRAWNCTGGWTESLWVVKPQNLA